MAELKHGHERASFKYDTRFGYLVLVPQKAHSRRFDQRLEILGYRNLLQSFFFAIC